MTNTTAADDRFPFGAASKFRPPRLADGPARVAVVGVYPSAVHVRWDLPNWAVQRLGLAARVGALAVDVEPVVFWDGTAPDAAELVDSWIRNVGFRPGDEPGQQGRVRAQGNGTSGRAVTANVLTPLGIAVGHTFFTDVVPRFFVKSSSGKSPKARSQQGDRLRDVYQPFAEAAGLPPASLPARPSPTRLVAHAVRDHAARLRRELSGAAAPLVVTVGEEARATVAKIADEASGAPLARLTRDGATYGSPGVLRIDGYRARWCALAHPGNRSRHWRQVHERWAAQAAGLTDG